MKCAPREQRLASYSCATAVRYQLSRCFCATTKALHTAVSLISGSNYGGSHRTRYLLRDFKELKHQMCSWEK